MKKKQIIGRVTIHLFICSDILSNGRFYHRHRKNFPGKSHFLVYHAYKREVDPTHLKFYVTIIQFDPSTQERKKENTMHFTLVF